MITCHPRTLLAFTLMGATGTACLGPSDGVCTANLVFGLTVTVRDSLTDLPAGRQATVVVKDGSYVEILQFLGAFSPSDSLTFFGAAERPGTYEVTVRKAAYQTWTRAGVEVDAGRCHVRPVVVEARLQPLSATRARAAGEGSALRNPQMQLPGA